MAALTIFGLSLSCLILACATPSHYPRDSGSTPVSTLDTPSEFTVLTSHVPHGLRVGKFWANQGESPEHNQERFRLQVRQLVQVHPHLHRYRANIDRPGKVDCIFFFPLHSHDVPKKGCVKQERFGLEADASGLPGSDDAGVLNTYTISAP